MRRKETFKLALTMEETAVVSAALAAAVEAAEAKAETERGNNGDPEPENYLMYLGEAALKARALADYAEAHRQAWAARMDYKKAIGEAIPW